MQRKKRVFKWWYVLGLIVVAGGVVVGVMRTRTSASDETDLTRAFTVERGNLVSTISPTGEVYAPRQVDLAFDDIKNKTLLIELNVEPGQKVVAGDVLARIDPTALERAVIQAEADLTVAQDNLDTARNPYSDLDLIQAELAVEQAEVALEEARENLTDTRNPATELDLTQARLAVDQAKTSLASAKESLATLEAGPTEAELASAEAAVAAAEESYEKVLARPNPEDIEREKLALDRARNSLWSTQMSRDATCGGPQRGSACDSAEVSVLNGEISVQLAEMSYQEALLPATASEIANAAAQVQRAKEELEELRNSPDAVDLAQAESQVTQAEYNLAKAQESLAELEAGAGKLDLVRAETQVTLAEYNLAKAQESLDDVKAGPDPKEIEVAEAKMVSARATLEEAQDVLASATMVAPYDGTIISVGVEVDDLVWPDSLIITLADLSDLRVRAMVDETDISKVEIGQPVEVTFDAFPGKRFWGEVLEVPLQGSLVQSILIYEVPVSLAGATDVSLKPGMTANVDIVVGRRENALLVPVMAVQQGEEGNVVLVQDIPDGPEVPTQVQVGLDDGMYVEVVRGLNEGDQVLVRYEQATEQGFGPMGMGSGGMQRMMRR